MSAPLLRGVGLTMVYEAGRQLVTALPPADIEIRAGDFLAITGPSGAGKTTLLNILSGIERPTAGEVFFEDRRLTDFSSGELARWRASAIGFVFQSYNLVSVLTARENVELPGYVHGYPREERRKRCDSALRLVGMEHRETHFPDQLSGGERQRIAIARALMTSPPLLLCDEPTGNLDGQNAELILDLLETLNKEYQKTIVLVTHDARAAARAAKVLHLEK
ncbi:MAG: ABC transporter ATP-binding protein [Allosphingosinicella sp.]